MLWSGWAWAVFALVVPLAWGLIVSLPGLNLRRQVARFSARLTLALAGLAPRVSGTAQLEGSQPRVIVANHASYLDALILLAALPAHVAFVAKRELLGSPLAALPLRRLGCVFVERFDSARSLEDSQRLGELAAAGDSLLFFAEGTFRKSPGLLPFRMGAFITAAVAGIPLVPVTLIGSRALLPDQTWRPRFSRLQVLIGQPQQAAGSDWAAALALRDGARRQILARLGEPDLSA
jgi:1-acyl-sn-glycerol-3-phosphate acyltransferase